MIRAAELIEGEGEAFAIKFKIWLVQAMEQLLIAAYLQNKKEISFVVPGRAPTGPLPGAYYDHFVRFLVYELETHGYVVVEAETPDGARIDIDLTLVLGEEVTRWRLPSVHDPLRLDAEDTYLLQRLLVEKANEE